MTLYQQILAMKMITEIWNSNIERNECNTYRCNEINVKNIYRYITLRMNHEVWISKSIYDDENNSWNRYEVWKQWMGHNHA